MVALFGVGRLYRRDDAEKGGRVAKARGYLSYYDLMQLELDAIAEKISLATLLGSSVVYFDVAENGNLNGPYFYQTQGRTEQMEMKDRLQEMADQFSEWWKP